MLNVLRRIVQKVGAATELDVALSLIVENVREAMQTDACSIFLLDAPRSEYVLMATQGLNAAAVGQVRCKRNEGLVGWVGERGEPINIENAQEHPKFYYVKQAEEECYRAFLGVPIINQRQLLGAIVVQQREERRYDEGEEAFLVTISAQLAGIIAQAEASGAMRKLVAQAKASISLKDSHFKGLPCVPGVGIGTAVVVYPPADLEAVPQRTHQDLTAELQLFESALNATRQEVRELCARLPHTLPAEERALFDVYVGILESNSLGAEIRKEIQTGQWAQSAVAEVIKRHIRQMELIDDDYLRERASDIKDLGRRLLAQLQAGNVSAPTYPDKVILVGEELTAGAIAQVPEGRLQALVSARGSSNSHVAILARAMGIPTVMGVDGLSPLQFEGENLVVDGYYGQVYLSPSKRLLRQYEALAAEERELDANLQSLLGTATQTQDGHPIALYVNAGLLADADVSLNVGAEGVGLYRTEIPFLASDRFPAEEEQHQVYQQLLHSFAPKPVTMRTLDIGGDKELPYFTIQEDNPYLGWRGVRVTLDHPELFRVQVRAMLRASSGLNNLRIMLPMISGVDEVEECQRLIQQAHQEILEEGHAIQMPQLGVMIEVPAAVYQAKALARRVDFLSVGSNDLTQYILAVDRNNSRVAGLYNSLHPAVLHALNQIVIAAHHEGKPVGICGEMAADPMAVILLLAMGFDSLSVNAVSLLRVKWVISRFRREEAQQLLNQALRLDNPADIRQILQAALEERGLGGLLRAGSK